MKYPVYIVSDEPRVRRRFWTQDKRVRTAAREAISGGNAPGTFTLGLPAPHPNNPNKYKPIIHIIGHLSGIITSIVTVAV